VVVWCVSAAGGVFRGFSCPGAVSTKNSTSCGCQNQHKTQALRSQWTNTASIDPTESVTLEPNSTRGYTPEQEHRLNNNSYKIHIFKYRIVTSLVQPTIHDDN
jgi:hypothetical protein